MQKKHKWFKLLKAKLITYNSYKIYCNKLKFLLKCAESNYYENRFSTLKTNPKANWDMLKNLLGSKPKSNCNKLIIDGVTYTNDSHIVNLFADYFSKIAIDLANDIPAAAIDGLQHIVNNDRSFFFFVSTPSEVCNVIMKLKASSDKQILSKLLKLGADHFSSLISSLFNLCIAEGVYPDCFKIAKIIPVFKKVVGQPSPTIVQFLSSIT